MDHAKITFGTIDFYFFSGTGNTLLVVKKMQEVFENQGSEVHLFPIEKADPTTINLDHVIGLGFPVAEQGTYPFVWDFIRALPESNGTPIFMVDTLLLFSGGVVGPVKKILRQKGYTPLAAKEILMPNNLFPKTDDEQKKQTKITRGLQQAEQYAHAILHGETHWGRIPVLSDIMGVFSQREWTWKFLRKGYRLELDRQKCIQCGLCVNLCPIKNIMMHEYPEYNNTCVICMRCIAFCPTQAIYASKAHFSSHKTYALHKAVKAAELLHHEKK